MVRCPQDLLTFNCLLFSVMHLKRNMGKVSEMWIIELERLSQQFKLLGHQWCFQTFTTCCKATTFSCLLARVSAGEPFLLKTNWQTGICLHSFYSKACVSVGLCALFAFFSEIMFVYMTGLLEQTGSVEVAFLSHEETEALEHVLHSCKNS